MINHINAGEKPNPDEDALPETFGTTDRWGYVQNIDRGSRSALTQAMGIKTVNPPSNANDYIYARTVGFPQPAIIGIGVVTAAGAKDPNTFFYGDLWAVTNTAAGNYTITHNIGDRKYNVVVSPVATTAFTANISAFNNNDFQVRTWNAAGAATNCSFTFIVYMIP